MRFTILSLFIDKNESFTDHKEIVLNSILNDGNYLPCSLWPKYLFYYACLSYPIHLKYYSMELSLVYQL